MAPVLTPEALEVLEELAFWLRFNAIILPIVMLPIILMLFSMWYMTKRLFELHTTEVKRSGFGTGNCIAKIDELIKELQKK